MLSCSKCKLVLSSSDFSPRQDRKRGFSSVCKTCKAKQKQDKQFLPATDGFKACSKCGNVLHVTQFFVCSTHTDGRDSHCKACEHKRKMHRLNTRKECRIVENLRRRTRAVLQGINKSANTLDLIGCTPEQLRDHIESQFEDGMTWENYGEWHIDHKRPCASFDLMVEAQQRECFNFTNLGPLWAKDNLSKGDRYDG